MKFAKWIYRIAGIYGLLVLAPLLFLERTLSQTSPPAITHPEYYYGFAITGVAWQMAFIVIGNDPQRFRTLMPVTWLEKSWGLIAIALYVQGRISSQVLALGLIDLLLGALFVGVYLTTRHNTKPNDRTDNQEEAVTRVTSRDEDIEIGYVDISSLKKAALVLNELEVVVHDENRDGKHKLIVYN